MQRLEVSGAVRQTVNSPSFADGYKEIFENKSLPESWEKIK